MQKILRKGPLLAGALVFTFNIAAQQSPFNRPRITETNAAVEFNFERAQVAETGTPEFWLKGEMQMGGGLDLAVAKDLGFRPLEIDWLHTNLPNHSAGTQNDFRVAFGVCYRR